LHQSQLQLLSAESFEVTFPDELRARVRRLTEAKQLVNKRSQCLTSVERVKRLTLSQHWKAWALGGTILCVPAISMTAWALELAPGFDLKTELVFAAETQRNLDLDDAEKDAFSYIEPKINLEFEAEPIDQFKAVLEVEASLREVIEDDNNDNKNERKLKTKQAYILFEPDNTDLSLIAGRQSIDDEMEWLIDEHLDGARLTLEAKPFGFDAYVGRKSLVNLSTPDEIEERVTNYAAFLQYKFDEKNLASAYVFFRDGDRFVDDGEITEEDLLFLGVQSIGKLNAQTSYWFNAAYLTGDRREGDAKETISAFGGDLGATYVFDAKLDPSLTLGFAYGSGDSNTDDSVDRTFRQTGLHDNSHTFNGVTSFSYLGQVLEPEIGNLMVFTAGVGINPSEKSSLDLVYHYYRQVEASDDLVDSNLDMDPSGDSTDIGHGLDLVFGYREIENVAIKAGVGVFMPGRAFPDSSGAAYFGKIEMTYSF
jgi:alginate production protein